MIEEINVQGDIELGIASFKIPALQFGINESQTCVALGINFDTYPKKIDFEDVEGLEYIHWGKLSECNIIFQMQIRNTLAIDLWDFDTYPDPEIVIIQDNRE